MRRLLRRRPGPASLRSPCRPPPRTGRRRPARSGAHRPRPIPPTPRPAVIAGLGPCHTHSSSTHPHRRSCMINCYDRLGSSPHCADQRRRRRSGAPIRRPRGPTLGARLAAAVRYRVGSHRWVMSRDQDGSRRLTGVVDGRLTCTASAALVSSESARPDPSALSRSQIWSQPGPLPPLPACQCPPVDLTPVLPRGRRWAALDATAADLASLCPGAVVW